MHKFGESGADRLLRSKRINESWVPFVRQLTDVAVVAERVDHDVDRVVAPERLVALHLPVDDAVGLVVEVAEIDV